MLGGWCRLGVLVEVNCETDFVARGDKFKELVADMAMQIAACDVSVVAAEDTPAEEVERERAIEMQKEDIQSKPEAIRYTTLYRVHEDQGAVTLGNRSVLYVRIILQDWRLRV